MHIRVATKESFSGNFRGGLVSIVDPQAIIHWFDSVRSMLKVGDQLKLEAHGAAPTVDRTRTCADGDVVYREHFPHTDAEAEFGKVVRLLTDEASAIVFVTIRIVPRDAADDQWIHQAVVVRPSTVFTVASE